MANVPILSLEASILLEEEVNYIQSAFSLFNGSIINLDNSGNMKRNPIINIKLNDTFFSGFTIINQTTGVTITIPSPSINYLSGSIFTIYADSVYLDSIEINAIFSAPFVIAENIINKILFTIPESTTIDVSVQWIRPDGNQVEELYVQGFNLNRVNTINKLQVNKLNKYTSGYYTTEINYTFSIDKLFYNNYHFSIDPSKTYRISWKTDTDVLNIEHMTKYLCGCKFNSIGISHTETELIKEGLQGNSCVLLD